MRFLDKNDTDVEERKATDIFGLEDRVFPLSFVVIKLSGFWRPTTFKIPLNFCYEFYTLFCFVSIIMLVITIIVDNVITEKTIRSLIENLYLILTISNAVSKLFNIYFRRSKVISILQRNMEDRWCGLRDDEETKIVEESIYSEKYNNIIPVFLILKKSETFSFRIVERKIMIYFNKRFINRK